jgi:hypothetical protein
MERWGIRHISLKWVLMAASAGQSQTASPDLAGRARILLIEDDDGDALLVEELLNEAGAGVTVQRARCYPRPGN